MTNAAIKRYHPGDIDPLQELASVVLAKARKAGATDAEIALGTSHGLHIEVREGEVETIEHNQGQGLSLSVYLGQRKGSASTNDFREESLNDTVEAAYRIASAGNEDPHAGLADPKWLATEQPDLDMDHPQQIEPARAIAAAAACEASALAVDTRISNSEGASFSRDRNTSVYANSRGFSGGLSSTRYSLGASVVTGTGDKMQRAHWYDSARAMESLASAEQLGRTAGERAVARIGARKIASTRAPVLFEAPVAASLIGHLSSAISGSALYRRASFLLDAIDTLVFPEHIQIAEHPHLPAGAASANFDSDGVATRERDIIKDGRLLTYALSVYAARRLELEPTGNGGGLRNVSVIHDGDAPTMSELCQQMGSGLLVTGLMGFGVNTVTGDYSRGATGLWIENGEIAYPVEEITIAGKLQDMFKGILAVGSDIDRRGNVHCGSILIDDMAIAGD